MGIVWRRFTASMPFVWHVYIYIHLSISRKQMYCIWSMYIYIHILFLLICKIYIYTLYQPVLTYFSSIYIYKHVCINIYICIVCEKVWQSFWKTHVICLKLFSMLRTPHLYAYTQYWYSIYIYIFNIRFLARSEVALKDNVTSLAREREAFGVFDHCLLQLLQASNPWTQQAGALLSEMIYIYIYLISCGCCKARVLQGPPFALFQTVSDRFQTSLNIYIYLSGAAR